MSITFSRERTFPSDLRGFGLRRPSATDIKSPPVVQAPTYEEEPFSPPSTELEVPQTQPQEAPESIHRFLGLVQLPFCAYLVLNDRLPGWARLLALASGVTTLVYGVKESE